MARLLYLGSGVGLTALYVLHGASGEAGLARADLPWLAGTVIFGGMFGPILLMYDLSFTDAASAQLLLDLEAVLTLAIAWLVFREYIDRRLFVGAAAIVAGALLLSWQGEFGKAGWGALLIALACLAWSIDNNLTRKISGADPVFPLPQTRV